MKILHFADLHLGVESYGRIDPATGISSRLLDFLAALDQVVDCALENRVDLVLFCGDAYKSREPSQTQQREFARRISRLSTGGIPIFLLIGNHDLPNAIGKATTTEIFDTLAVKNVYVSNRPDIYRIQTNGGTVQVASLPWLRRSALFGKEETKNLDFEQINQRLQQVLTNIIAAHVSKLDPGLPSILAAHVGVASATVGSERLMAIGQEHFLLLGNVANPAFDYVALGHIHKHQVLSDNPPVVYAGSLERVDFGEEEDEKGFYLVEIGPGKGAGQRSVSFAFHPVRGRRFLTINVNLVRSFVEKPDVTDIPEKPPINAGVYVIDRDFILSDIDEFLPEKPNTDLAKTLLERLAKENKPRLAAYFLDLCAWFDVGTLEQLIDANLYVASQRG
ncbi:exonuclease subunit SbcD [Chloroflexota bacterium]